jgi:hypothetical protein
MHPQEMMKLDKVLDCTCKTDGCGNLFEGKGECIFCENFSSVCTSCLAVHKDKDHPEEQKSLMPIVANNPEDPKNLIPTNPDEILFNNLMQLKIVSH